MGSRMTINIWQDFLSQPIYEARLYESFTRKDPPFIARPPSTTSARFE